MINYIKKITILIIVVISYVTLYITLRYLFQLLPDARLWRSLEFWLIDTKYNLYVIDVIYFGIGLVCFSHGVLRLVGITKQNHTVRDEKTRLPKSLLKDGYYSEVRHPMYGTFILIQLGLMFSLRTMLGLVIAAIIILVQNINGRVEEKTQLIKIFGDEYENYKQIVKARYLTKIMKIYFIIALLLSVFGIVFM